MVCLGGKLNIRIPYYKARLWLDSTIELRKVLANTPIKQNCQSIGYICHAGMCNRLAAHIAATYLGSESARQVAIHWPKNPHCAATFTDLFEVPSEEVGRLPKYLIVPYERGPHALPKAKEMIQSNPDRFIILEDKWQFALRSNIEECIIGLKQSQSSILQPRADIVEEVDAEVSQWPGPMLGIHLRRGDFVRLGHATPMARFETGAREILRQRPDLVGIFLASDSTDDSLLLPIQRLGVPVLRRQYHGRESVTGIESALVDLLLLSRTQSLLLSPRSSFGMLASLLGGVTATTA